MKIKINEKEFYNIELPEEIDVNDFFGILRRLHYIEKLIGKDPLLEIAKEYPYIRKKRKDAGIKRKKYERKIRGRKFNYNRDEAVRIVNIHYNGSKEEKLAVATENRTTWANFSKRMFTIKKKWNIKPNEVGLISFPTKGNQKVDEYIIKGGNENKDGVNSNAEEKEENTDKSVVN